MVESHDKHVLNGDVTSSAKGLLESTPERIILKCSVN